MRKRICVFARAIRIRETVMDAQGEGERRPMNRDPGQQVLVDTQQPHDPQRRLPDPSYPRSAEGILRMVAVVSRLYV